MIPRRHPGPARSRLARRAVAVVAVLLLAGCAATPADGPVEPLPPQVLPATVLGDLTVEPVDVSDDLDGATSLVEATSLWRVRADGDTVATVQIATLRADDATTEEHLVTQFGAVRPQTLRIGSHRVHVSLSDDRVDSLAVLDGRLLVVSALRSFERRRTLVRAVLDLVDSQEAV